MPGVGRVTNARGVADLASAAAESAEEEGTRSRPEKTGLGKPTSPLRPISPPALPAEDATFFPFSSAKNEERNTLDLSYRPWSERGAAAIDLVQQLLARASSRLALRDAIRHPWVRPHAGGAATGDDRSDAPASTEGQPQEPAPARLGAAATKATKATKDADAAFPAQAKAELEAVRHPPRFVATPLLAESAALRRGEFGDGALRALVRWSSLAPFARTVCRALAPFLAATEVASMRREFILLELEGPHVAAEAGAADPGRAERRRSSRERGDATRRLSRSALTNAIAARSVAGADESAAAAIADIVVRELGGAELGGCVGWSAYVSAMMTRKTVHSAQRVEAVWATILKRRAKAAAEAARKQRAAAQRRESKVRVAPLSLSLRLDTTPEEFDEGYFGADAPAGRDTSPLQWHRLSAHDLATHFLACDAHAEGDEEGGGARVRCAAAVVARWGSGDEMTCTQFIRACSEGVAEFVWSRGSGRD